MSILIKPHLTEKSLTATGLNRYTFIVKPTATKGQIKEAVESLFNVNVVNVTTTSRPSTTERSHRTGRYRTKARIKKATVQLKDKQTINFFETK